MKKKVYRFGTYSNQLGDPYLHRGNWCGYCVDPDEHSIFATMNRGVPKATKR